MKSHYRTFRSIASARYEVWPTTTEPNLYYRALSGATFVSRNQVLVAIFLDSFEMIMNTSLRATTSAIKKVILVTGATDGIGLEVARRLVSKGHKVLLHGRNAEKLASVAEHLVRTVTATSESQVVETYECDFSKLSNVLSFAESVKKRHRYLDVLVNNAGTFVPEPGTTTSRTPDDLDVRFAVNTYAPYLLTRQLWDLFDIHSRVINVTCAAGLPVDIDALKGKLSLEGQDNQAFAQSKVAMMHWSMFLGRRRNKGPSITPINPGSLLKTKMTATAYGIPGTLDVMIGADILVRAALSDEFRREIAKGRLYNNDRQTFVEKNLPYDINVPRTNRAVIQAMEEVILKKLGLPIEFSTKIRE